MISEHLRKLKEITPKLPELVLTTNHRIDYDVSPGLCHGVGLLNNKRIAVQDAFISKGSQFPVHTHDSIEWLIVYSGRLKAVAKDDTFLGEIGVGEGVKFPSGQEHSIIALEDTRLLGVTIPSDEGYPDAER